MVDSEFDPLFHCYRWSMDMVGPYIGTLAKDETTTSILQTTDIDYFTHSSSIKR